jgi:hypothetical protein
MSATSWSWPGVKATPEQQDKALHRLGNELGRYPVFYPDRLVTAAYIINTADGVVLADATGGAFTVTLPAASAYYRRRFTVVRMNGGGNAVTIATVLGGNITLGAQYARGTVQSCLTTAPATFTWVQVD